MRVNERVPCTGATEALYQSVFDFEYMTLKRIKMCVGFNNFFLIFIRYNEISSVITDRIRIYNG